MFIWACARAAGGMFARAPGGIFIKFGGGAHPGAMGRGAPAMAARNPGGIGPKGPSAGTGPPGPIGGLGMAGMGPLFSGAPLVGGFISFIPGGPGIPFIPGIPGIGACMGGGVRTDNCILVLPATSRGKGILTSVKSTPSISSSSSPSLSFSRNAWEVLSSAFLKGISRQIPVSLSHSMNLPGGFWACTACTMALLTINLVYLALSLYSCRLHLTRRRYHTLPR
jgi:hypothetical protein